MDIATLTLLVDLKLVTVEQVAQRIELIRAALGDQYESDDVKSRLRLVADWLVEQNPHAQTERASWTPQVIDGGLHPKSDDQEL